MGLSLDGLIRALSPQWGLRRELARRTYEAIQSTPQRRPKGNNSSANAALYPAGDKLRAYARHLDENHDLAIGILDTLVNNIVGTGITVEPMVARKNGALVEKLNDQIRTLWDAWADRPEVTRTYALPSVERLACRSWLRDGEVLAQLVNGRRADLAHTTEVPFSIEMLEADFLPTDYVDEKKGIWHGVQMDAWGAPRIYWLHKQHPGDKSSFAISTAANLKTIKAEDAIHLKFARRFHQVRGVSIFHGVLGRLDDIKMYEESELIAARVAAAFTAFIKKSADLAGATTNAAGNRSFEMSPGFVFDNLLPGEDVGMISSDRPNTNLAAFVGDQMRRVASGTGTSASSISKRYDGTYSAQRQEMVEVAPNYKVMRDYFIAHFMQPIYRRFIDMAVMSGQINVPAGVDAYKCAWFGVGQPWIDPEKETKADALAVESRFKSRHQIIRERGGDPRQVDEQLKREREQDKANGVEPIVKKPEAPAEEPADANETDSEAAA